MSPADPECVALEGFHAVKHAVRFGAEITTVVVSETVDLSALIAGLAPELAEWFLTTAETVTVDEYRRVSNRPHPTGVWASAVPPIQTAWPDVSRTAPAIVIEDPRNHGNFGAAVRIAAAGTAAAIGAVGELDVWSAAALRGSAGLHFAIPVLSLTSFPDTDRPVIAFDPEGVDLSHVDLPDDAVLVFGSERHGLTDAVKERADIRVGFPMREGVSSINLAASVAIGLYHWRLCN